MVNIIKPTKKTNLSHISNVENSNVSYVKSGNIVQVMGEFSVVTAIPRGSMSVVFSGLPYTENSFWIYIQVSGENKQTDVYRMYMNETELCQYYTSIPVGTYSILFTYICN